MPLYNVVLQTADGPSTRKTEPIEAVHILDAWTKALDKYYKEPGDPEWTPYQIVAVLEPEEEQMPTHIPLI